MNRLKTSLTPCFVFFYVSIAFAQTLPSDRSVNWSLSGYRGTAPELTNIIDITNYGAQGDSLTPNDNALAEAITALGNTPGVIHFPSGIFLFHSPVSLTSGVVLKGEGVNNTILKFDFSSQSNAITISGNVSETTAQLISDGDKGDTLLTINNASGFQPGNYIELHLNDSDLVTSDWAVGAVGQLIKIRGIQGNKLILESPLRMDYPLDREPFIIKLNMVTEVGIECLKISCMNATSEQTSTIFFNYAAQCYVKNIESEMGNFAHITLQKSTNISVSGSYFHDAHGYGDGGQGYGVMCQLTSNENKIENNIFNHLRHAMIIQAGANANVYAYNYSINPYWTDVSLPSNSAGDMVLHGNFAYCNLFESNIGQNIVIDDSHGKNGMYNTFFRNRADLYGIFMNNNPATDEQNFIGNEITNNELLMGNYLLSGTGHFQYGNNVKGNITPTGTNSLPDTSLYLTSKPGFLQNVSAWPSVGIPTTLGSGNIPAKLRFEQHNYVSCISDTVSTEPTSNTFVPHLAYTLFPNPTQGKIQISFNRTPSYSSILILSNVFDETILIRNHLSVNNDIDLSIYSKGIYFLRVIDIEHNMQLTEKIILQ